MAAFFYFLAVVGGLLGAYAEEGSGATSIEELLERTREVQQRDLTSWKGYSFRRKVVREKFDGRGAVKFRQVLLFDVLPRDGGFEERLLEINSRPPTPREVRSHQQAGRFAKHYREMLTGETDNDLIGQDLSIPSILDHAAYEYEETELMGGVPCHRLGIRSRPLRTTTASQQLADATEGTLWVSVEGSHLVRWDTHLVRPVSRGIARVDRLDLKVNLKPRGASWLPSSIDLASVVRIGPVTLRKKNFYLYTEFRK